MKKTLLVGALLLGTQPLSAATDKPIASGSAMAWQCAPCHGTNGQEFLEAMPPLAGMPAEQFTRIMLDYREGRRAAVVMDRVARGFTDAEIEAMAVWFEKQPLKQWENTGLNEVYQAEQAAAKAATTVTATTSAGEEK